MLKTKNDNGIINLIVVFAVGLFALAGAIAIAAGAAAGVSQNRNISSGNNMFYAAESALEEGVYQYIGSLSGYGGGQAVLVNGASYSAVSVTSLEWPYVEISGDSNNSLSYRGVTVLLTLFPEGFAFDHAVYAQDELTFGGNATVNGSVFANNGIEFIGNSAEINGAAYSPGGITNGEGNINGEVVTGVEVIPSPVIEIEPYREDALAAGTYFDNSAGAQTYLNNNIREAVVFVESGSLTKIQGSNTKLTGSIAVTGDLSINGGVFVASPGYVAVVVEGDLKIAGGATINGIVYVKGKTSFGSGNNTINGSLISAGGVSVTDITGNTTINYEPSYLSDWEDLKGLKTTSAVAPQVMNWSEE